MKTRYKVIKKEEERKNDAIAELKLYISDEELSDVHLVHAVKGIKNNRYIDGRIEDKAVNMFDLSLALVNYDIKFYDIIGDSFITSKLNKLVMKKNPNINLRKTTYETLDKEESAYFEEEDRAYKELIKECNR